MVIIGISSTKRSGSEIKDLDDRWKLFYSSVKPAKFALACVWILIRAQLASCVGECIQPGRRVCIIRLKLLDRSLCLIKSYGSKSNALHPEFMEGTSSALKTIKITNTRSFWETSMHTMGTMPVHERI